MNAEKQRIAIAEACGWKLDKRGLGWLDSSGCYSEIPDYLNDLNAMHEAEKHLEPDQWATYSDRLMSISRGLYKAFHATAAQRAEAFLKTLGKWEVES